VSRRALALALAGLALAGCTLGPDYRRPAVPVPEGWRLPAEAGRSLAAVRWWELFEDETLRGLIHIALEENMDLRLAVARVAEAVAQVRFTRADQLPTVGGSAQYLRQRGSRVAQRPTIPDEISVEQDQWQVALQATFELDLWGRLRRATESARAQLLATEEARRTVVITLVSAVAQAYFDVLDLDEELSVSRGALGTRREALRILRLREKAGITSILDVSRAEEEEAGTAAIIPDLERQVAQAENALSILLGRNPGPIPRGRSLTAQIVPPSVPAGLPSDLLAQRPDVVQAEQQLVAANANIGVARAAFFPRIVLTGAYGVESLQLGSLFTTAAQIWQLGPQVTVPIYTGGKLQAGVDTAEARREQARIAYRQTIQQAFREVEDALVAHRKAREVREHQEREVTAARRALDLAQRRYLNGLTGYLDVLDAQRQLFADEIDLTRTIRAQIGAVVQVYKALGGGWTPEADQVSR
jgi:multidrug efflux system outer membrane protein